MLTPCLVKLFRLCLSTSTSPSCWKYAFIQPVPKKGDRCNPSNYSPIALLSCLSKAFESILNQKIQKHLCTSDLLSDCQYEFCKGLSTGNLLSLLTDSWSFSLSRFDETFSVTLDISKAFNRVWRKSLLSKLLSFGFYLSLCSIISSFLSGCSISALVDGHCSSNKPINSGVPQGSVLSPTLFLLFINDLFSVTNRPIHSCADDSTLDFSTSFDRRPTLQDSQDFRLEAAERLTSDLAIISDWGRRNLVSFNASRNSISSSITRFNLLNSYPLFFDNTQLSPSTLNILSLSFTQNLNWKPYLLSQKISFLEVGHSVSSPPVSLPYTVDVPCPPFIWSTYHMYGGTPCAQVSWTEWSLRLFVSSVLPLSLTVFSLLNSATKLPLSLSSVVIFTLTALLNLLTACLPPFCGLTTPAFPLKLIPLLSKSLMLELTSIFTLSSHLLVNSGTISLHLYFLLPTT